MPKYLAPKTVSFPFGTFGDPILKHITVYGGETKMYRIFLAGRKE